MKNPATPMVIRVQPVYLLNKGIFMAEKGDENGCMISCSVPGAYRGTSTVLYQCHHFVPFSLFVRALTGVGIACSVPSTAEGMEQVWGDFRRGVFFSEAAVTELFDVSVSYPDCSTNGVDGVVEEAVGSDVLPDFLDALVRRYEFLCCREVYTVGVRRDDGW